MGGGGGVDIIEEDKNGLKEAHVDTPSARIVFTCFVELSSRSHTLEIILTVNWCSVLPRLTSIDQETNEFISRYFIVQPRSLAPRGFTVTALP